MITAVRLGVPEALTVWGGIAALNQEGHAFLALIVFVFTLVFPPLKQVSVVGLSIWGHHLSVERLECCKKAVFYLSGLSLLDVFVVALLVVMAKTGVMLRMEPAPGIYLFCFSILLSLPASVCLKLDSMSGEKAEGTPIALERLNNQMVAVATILLALGLGLWLLAPGKSVKAVTVSKKETFEAINFQLFKPSYGLVVDTSRGRQDLGFIEKTPIGNGLTWELQKPVHREQVAEVKFYEKKLLGRELIDRVQKPGDIEVGEAFVFTLEGSPSIWRWAAWFFCGAGLVAGLLGFKPLIHTNKH
jgi:hypothetical protein